MLTPFLANVQKGKLRIYNREDFDRFVATLDGEVVLAVGNQRKKRSDNQNRWYWGCIVKLAGEWCGYHSDEMHDAFKMMFLKREEQGKPPTIRSTASLSTVEFAEFCEQCRAWCEEQNIHIPDPLSYYEEQIKNT